MERAVIEQRLGTNDEINNFSDDDVKLEDCQWT